MYVITMVCAGIVLCYQGCDEKDFKGHSETPTVASVALGPRRAVPRYCVTKFQFAFMCGTALHTVW